MSLGFVDREEGAQAREGTEGGGEGGGQGREEGTVVVCMIFNVPQRKGRNQMRHYSCLFENETTAINTKETKSESVCEERDRQGERAKSRNRKVRIRKKGAKRCCKKNMTVCSCGYVRRRNTLCPQYLYITAPGQKKTTRQRTKETAEREL